MSFRCDSTNQIIVPFGGIRRQEECRLPACVMQIVQNSRRVFVRRAVIGKIHADRLFRRLFLYLWYFDGIVVHRLCRCRIGIRVIAAVRLGSAALVAVDRVLNHLGMRCNKRRIALCRAVRDTQHIFPLQGQ